MCILQLAYGSFLISFLIGVATWASLQVGIQPLRILYLFLEPTKALTQV